MRELTPELLEGIAKNGPTDPIEYYRRPLVGYLYRERINMGLRLLEGKRFESALEIGYGAGAVLLALASASDKLAGIDLDADPEPVQAMFRSKGHAAPELRKANVYELPFEAGVFDLVVSFSVFEHLHEYRRALDEVARVLRPGGMFLLGMPEVNKAMEWAFRAIGFKGIEDHHVTTPRSVSGAFGPKLRVAGSKRLGVPGATVYYVWLLERASP